MSSDVDNLFHFSRDVNQDRILWLDVETSGTSPESDELLEVGAIVTDMAGNFPTRPFSMLCEISNLSQVIASSDEAVRNMHESSKLWNDLWSEETFSRRTVDRELSSYILEYSYGERIYMGGNSITLDRQFVRANLPISYSLISYRSVDVTSISLAVQSNSSIPGYEKTKEHRALADVYDSIEEYKHYLKWLKLSA